MNKTAILSYIIDEVALKARKVSSNMRKRIHWMLTLKEITVRKYDKRALVLNGWIEVGKYAIQIFEQREMKKGVSNYILKNQQKLNKLIKLNNEIRCCRLLFNPTAPIEVESMQDLEINQDNFKIYSKCSFNKVKCLFLNKLSTNQIKFILTRFKRVYELRIYDCSLQKLDLSQSRIKQFFFDYISFKEPVYLPKEIEKLELRECESPNLIKAQKVNRIKLDRDTVDPKEYVELIKTLKGIKFARINDSLVKQYLPSLPSTIRKIDAPLDKVCNLEGVMNQFPYLIEVTRPFPFQPTDKSKIRMIEPILEETQEKFNLRPRKIKITSENALQLNNHPELFEKMEWVSIYTNGFNFDILPSGIKRIDTWNEVDIESITLNRLEKERG